MTQAEIGEQIGLSQMHVSRLITQALSLSARPDAGQRAARSLMRIAAGLAALAAGAILTFAVSARVPGINLRLAGVIIILAAIAGLIATSHAAQAWLRRGEPPAATRPAVPPDEDEFGDLGYLLQDPAVLAAEVLKGGGSTGSCHGPGGPGNGRTDGGRPGACAGTRATREVRDKQSGGLAPSRG